MQSAFLWNAPGWEQEGGWGPDESETGCPWWTGNRFWQSRWRFLEGWGSFSSSPIGKIPEASTAGSRGLGLDCQTWAVVSSPGTPRTGPRKRPPLLQVGPFSALPPGRAAEGALSFHTHALLPDAFPLEGFSFSPPETHARENINVWTEDVGKFLGPFQGQKVLVLGSWYLKPWELEQKHSLLGSPLSSLPLPEVLSVFPSAWPFFLAYIQARLCPPSLRRAVCVPRLRDSPSLDVGFVQEWLFWTFIPTKVTTHNLFLAPVLLTCLNDISSHLGAEVRPGEVTPTRLLFSQPWIPLTLYPKALSYSSPLPSSSCPSSRP